MISQRVGVNPEYGSDGNNNFGWKAVTRFIHKKNRIAPHSFVLVISNILFRRVRLLRSMLSIPKIHGQSKNSSHGTLLSVLATKQHSHIHPHIHSHIHSHHLMHEWTHTSDTTSSSEHRVIVSSTASTTPCVATACCTRSAVLSVKHPSAESSWYEARTGVNEQGVSCNS